MLENVLQRLRNCSSDISSSIPTSSSTSVVERCLELSVKIDPSTGRPCGECSSAVICSASFAVHLTISESSCSPSSLIQIDAELTASNSDKATLTHFKDYLEQNILRRNRRYIAKLIYRITEHMFLFMLLLDGSVSYPGYRSVNCPLMSNSKNENCF